MKKTFIYMLMASFCLALLPTLQAQSEYDRLSNASETVFDNLITNYQASTNIVGMSAAVVKGGQIVYLKGFGTEDGSSLASMCTVYRIASISKPITAIAALQLVEEGLLDLDVDIRNYVPEYPVQAKEALSASITMRNLLEHRSGIKHYNTDGPAFNATDRTNYVNANCPYDAVEAVRIFSGNSADTLRFAPGTARLYTSMGYNLAGAVVARAGLCERKNDNYAERVREKICVPLNMPFLQPEYPWKMPYPDQATLYNSAGNIYTNPTTNDGPDISWKLPSGGFIASVIDLALLMKGLMTDADFNSVDILGSLGGANQLGFFRETRAPGTNNILWHNGCQGGSSTVFYMDLATMDGVVLLANTAGYSCQNTNPQIENLARNMWDQVAGATTSNTTAFDETFNNNTFLSLSGSVNGTAVFEARTLESDAGAGYTINIGASRKLVGTRKIILNPGFTAKEGSFFLAHIGVTNVDCPDQSRANVSGPPLSSHKTVGTEVDGSQKWVSKIGLQVFPNPSHGTPTIEFYLPLKGEVSLSVTNLSGQEMIRLIDHEILEGNQELKLPAGNFAAGIYYCILQNGDQKLVQKFTIL